jgi:hypothetical protein
MRLNHGMPVWHVSVSVWSRRYELVNAPNVAEREAVKALRGVGGDREWWLWNDTTNIGHLRVAVTPQEFEQIPCGTAHHDAGESGPERPRTR